MTIGILPRQTNGGIIIMKKTMKILMLILTMAVMMTAFAVPAFADGSGDVAGAIESTWDTASEQIKQVVNNVVFPVIDLILAVCFFAKLGLAYFDCAPVKAM